MTAAGSDRSPLPEGPLAGVRVVDLSEGVSGPFATKWLGALGADVAKLEPPGGDRARREGPWPEAKPDPEASGLFLYLNAGKRSAVLDLESHSGRSHLLRLLAGADILVHSLRSAELARLELGPEVFARCQPDLVVVSVTPFGQTGPQRDLPGTNLTLSALSGMMWLVGEAGRAPLVQGGSQLEYLAGLHALGAALAGWLGVLRGRGSPCFDISAQECGASVVGHFTSFTSQMGEEAGRRPSRVLWRLYPCADGWAGVYGLPRNYPGLSQVMGIPEIREYSPLVPPAEMEETRERVQARLVRWFAARTRAEIRALAVEHRVSLGTVMTLGEVVESPQLRERCFFRRELHPHAGALTLPGRLWETGAHRWSTGRAPGLGEHERELLSETKERRGSGVAPRAPEGPADRPLRGIRVLDLGQVWAGPYAAMLLADQGADVIKVESPVAPDPNRTVQPPPPGHGASWWNSSAFFHEYNHNKRCIALDYRQPKGRTLLGRLAATCDVVVENFRADVIDRLGLGYDWLREQRPDVILLSMPAFGKTGPERDLPGYGPLIEQTAGLLALTGYDDEGEPVQARYSYGDPVAAVAGAAAATAALVHRERTGQGQHIDLAQREVMATLVGEKFAEWSMTGRQPPRLANAHPRHVPHGAYPCAGEEQWVAIAVTTDAEWAGLRTAMGDPAWAREPAYAGAAGRRRHRDLLDRRLGDWTGALRKEQVFARCAAEAVPAGPVWTMIELLRDPQLESRGFYETIRHPQAPPWRAHGWVWRGPPGPCVERLAPDFGGHNREVLVDELGLSEAELAELEAERIVASGPLRPPG